MKQPLKEGFIDKIFGMIKRGVVDGRTKSMMKKSPELAKAVKNIKNSYDELEKALENI
jgi:hypothetical protein